MPVLEVKNLVYAWPGTNRQILKIDTLTLNENERLFLCGPSGCGKSTLLSALAGTVDIAPGQINLGGIDVGLLKGGARDRFRGDRIGMIFQVFNLVPWMNAIDNVRLPCTFSPGRRKRAGEDPASEARRILSELDLPDELQRAPARTLSIGQQQRVAAARALIGQPALILADEPTSALDEDTKSGFVELLTKECSAAGTALLFVSHDRALAEQFDRSIDFRELNRGQG